MQLLFKITATTPPANPNVGHTNFQEHYTGVNTSMSWSEVAPVARQAVQSYMIDHLGQAWYYQLAAAYQAGTVAGTLVQALEYAQDAAAHYTVYKIMPMKANTLASLGNVQQSPEGGAQQTSKWAYDAKRLEALNDADAALDRLLTYMEARAEANDPLFLSWKTSTAYNTKKSDFFRNTADLDDFLNIKKSWRTFISLVPYLGQIERRTIVPLLCKPLYDALQAPTLSPENAALIPMLREAIAYLGAAEAVPHHRIVIEGDGFRVISQTDGFTDKRNQTNSIHEQAIGALMTRCQERGEEAIAALRKHLENNLDDYPLYRDSTCRTAPSSKGHGMVASDDRIGMVAIL